MKKMFGGMEKKVIYLLGEADGYQHAQDDVCQNIAQMCVFDFAELAAATC